MAQNGTFQPMGNLERGLVFPFWPDELDPEGQAAFCFQTGDIDTWGMKQGPDPVEYGEPVEVRPSEPAPELIGSTAHPHPRIVR